METHDSLERIALKDTIVILGMQWGDEGKGKIVHAIAEHTDCDVMVRFNGGANAGHTVELDDGTTVKYNQLPSGCELPFMRSVIANGSVVNPGKLVNEMVDKNIDLIISKAAHVVTPSHIMLDEKREASRKVKIGTTLTGNGPVYAAKMARTGMRAEDLCSPAIEIPLSERQLAIALEATGANIWDTQEYLMAAQGLEFGTMILEGSHGWELDIDHGDYPNVTSSSCSVGGAAIGTGLNPRSFTKVIGVVKSYSTRVGAGSFPNVMTDPERQHLRRNHPETGTVTGRKRRVDWIDVGRIRQACAANGVDSIALTHLDVLSGFYEIKLIDNDEIITFTGFPEDISNCKYFNDLPINAQEFVYEIQESVGVPVKLISVGPKKSQLIWMTIS